MSEARGFLGAGNILYNRVDPETGLYAGWVGPLYANKFALKSNATLKELKSKGRDDYGQILESVPLADPAEISMTLREANKENITLMFMGEQSVINQGAGTATAEAITLTTRGGAQLAFQNISATGITLTSSPAGTTYVKDTDYTVNYRLGIVQPIAGSDLADDITADADGRLPVLITYTYVAIAGTRVRGATQPQLRAWIKFDGKNIADGRPVIAEVYEAVLTPSGEFDFLGDDWNELPLTGRMKTPVGKAEPFTVDFRD